MKKLLLLFACCMLGSVWYFCAPAMAAPPDSDYVLVYEDDFNGTALNLSDWQYRTGKKYGGEDLPENVSVKDGKLYLDYKKINGVYTGGGIITKFNLPYGYYETKAKTFGGTGALHTSFWSSGGGDLADPARSAINNLVVEIDGFEINSERPDYISTGYIDWCMENFAHPRHYHEEIDTSQEEFILGYEWLPDRIIYYINGEKVKEDFDPKYYAPQYLWLTAVAMPEKKTDLIDDSKLPGSSYFDYFRYYQKPLKGENLLGNGEFEYNLTPMGSDQRRNLQLPFCFIEKGDVAASRIVRNPNAYGGECFLYHSDKGRAYQVFTSQRFEHLLNGSYTLSAWVKSSGGQEVARLVAKDLDGSVIKEAVVPQAADQWTLVELTDIPVTQNAVEVGLESKAAAGQWIMADEMSFFNQTGTTDYAKTVVFEGLPADTVYRNEILVKHDDPKNAVVTGQWDPSGAMPDSLWLSKNTPDANVTWTPEVPVKGDYVLQIYNNVYEKSDPAAKLEIQSAQGTVTTTINQLDGPSGWVTLGTYSFDKGKKGSVKLSKGGGGTTRANRIRLIPLEDYMVAQGVTLLLGHHVAFTQNKYKVIDRMDSTIVPFETNGTTYLPLRFLSEALGAQVTYEDASQTIQIQLDGKSITTQVGGRSLLVDGKTIPLSQPVFTRNDRTYLPLRVIAEAFGKSVFWDPSGLIVVTAQDLSLSPELISTLASNIKAQDTF